jgi:hypothetical protein
MERNMSEHVKPIDRDKIKWFIEVLNKIVEEYAPLAGDEMTVRQVKIILGWYRDGYR